MKKKKDVGWLKLHLSNQKKRHLSLVASGVARSYTGGPGFHLIDVDTLACTSVTAEGAKITELSRICGEPPEVCIRKFVDSCREMCFLMSEKQELPEKLTETPGWNIVCIYVTLSRSQFINVRTENNIRRCLVKIKAAFDDKPQITTKWWG